MWFSGLLGDQGYRTFSAYSSVLYCFTSKTDLTEITQIKKIYTEINTAKNERLWLSLNPFQATVATSASARRVDWVPSVAAYESIVLYLQNCVVFLKIYIRMTAIVSNWLVLFEISDRLCTDPSSVLATLLFCCVVSFVCADAMRVTVALF